MMLLALKGAARTAWFIVLGCTSTGTLVLPAEAQLSKLDGQPRIILGMLDGPEELVFGDIVDIDVDGTGNIFVLDRQLLEIRWFSPDGRYVDRAGGEGEGPGEFHAPRGLAVDSDGRVHVLDVRNARISMYDIADEGFVHLADTPGIRGYDLCILKDRRYVLLPHEGRVVHQLGDDGTVVRSFAPLEPLDPETERGIPAADAARVRWSSNLGALHCDGESGTILLLSERLPVVRAFSANGDLLWRATLDDYHRVHWEPGREGRGVRMAPDPESGTAHTGQAITTDPGDRVIVTLHEGSLNDPEGHLEAVVLSIRDGEMLERTDLPMTVARIRAGHIFGYQQYPFPRVVVF